MSGAFADLERTRKRWNNHAYYAKKVGKDHPWLLVRDWCSVVEVKLGRGGWNVHEHVIFDSSTPRLGYGSWGAAWKHAAGELGGHTDLQKLRNSVQSGVHYITAYLTKGAVWGGLTQQQAYLDQDTLRGKRFVRRKRGSAPPRIRSVIWERCCMPDHQNDCHEEMLWEA